MPALFSTELWDFKRRKLCGQVPRGDGNLGRLCSVQRREQVSFQEACLIPWSLFGLETGERGPPLVLPLILTRLALVFSPPLSTDLRDS